MITGIYEFRFFWSKNGRFVTHTKKGPETPIFIVFLGCVLFGPSCQKREILDTHPKRKKIFSDNWKAHFEYFLFFLVFFFGPPHLALNPPYLLVFLVFLLLFVFFLVPFLSLVLIEKPCFPPKRGIFWFIFSVSLSSSLNLFWPPPFLFLFLCLSFALVFLSSFLSFFFGFLFVSCFCLFFHCSFFFAFVSWIEQHENIKLQFLGFQWMCSLFLVSCLVFSLKYFFLSFFFPDFELCLLFNIIVCGFKKPKFKNTNFRTKGGLQHNVFFLSSCVLQNVKSYRFFCFFWQNFGCFSKAL